MTDIAQKTIASETVHEVISPRREVWLAFRAHHGAMAGLIFIAFIVFLAIFANFIAPNSPT